jgi:hypothetical protein
MGVSFIDAGESAVWELWMKLELKMESNLSGWTSVCVGRCVCNRLTEGKLADGAAKYLHNVHFLIPLLTSL